MLDALVFQAEAEIRWLDHCEARVARARRPASPPDPGAAGAPATDAPATEVSR